MAEPHRSPVDPVALAQALAREPHRFHPWHALRLFECAHPARPRLGRSVRVQDDPVRLGQEPALTFAPAAVAACTMDGVGPPRVAMAFFGVFGPNGPLPLHLTEYARDRMRNAADPTFSRFADVFHHRMLCLLYRAWASGQPALSFDRPDDDTYGRWIGAVAGYGTPGLLGRDALPDAFRRHHAGRLAGASRSPEALRDMITDFFRVPARIEEFVPQWLPLPPELLSRLGGASATLGVTATAGTRVHDVQGRFRIVLGPVGLEDFQRFLPGRDSVTRLLALVRSFLHDELAWDVQVVLRRDAVPATRLSATARLGWTTWLSSGPARHDASEYCIDPLTRLGNDA
jgi:type VI secretion system protein ImpH